MKVFGVLSIVFMSIAFMSGASQAIINPELFKRGPEQLVVKVVGRSVNSFSDVLSVQLLVEVVSVERSATALKPGNTVLVSYARYPERVKKEMEKRRRNPMPGPQHLYQPTAPKLDAVVKAYLRHLGGKHGRVYVPAAHQYSFARP